MKQKQLLQICLATSSSSTLFNYRRLNNIVTALYSTRTSYSGSHQRHRRAPSAPSPLSLYYRPYPGQRRRFTGERSNCRSFENLSKPSSARTDMGLERRMSRASPTTAASLNAVLNASSTDFRSEAVASGSGSVSTPISSSQVSEEGWAAEDSNTLDAKTSMPPPQPPAKTETSETRSTRSTRSTSSASRNANRLSLTLPIAPPNSFSSRPTPTSSMPPTPVDTLTLNSPVDSEDFIVAIAAQERRVLELREELARAEAGLKKLQRQWTISEACKKRPPNTTAEPRRALAPAASLRDGPAESPASKRHSELERRKAILLAQSQGASRQPRRTVIRGGHTRTLSLLSPTKSVSGMSMHEGQNGEQSPESFIIPSPTPPIRQVNKRATWAPPRSTQQPTGVKQLANDFKQGLWTFVEDLRQAAVGDEAISGTTNRTTGMGSRSENTDSNQDTIRASTSTRGRIPFSTELESPSDSPDTSSASSSSDRFQHRRTASKPEPRTRKHYSWTPLTFDSFDDDDWANWDSPNVKTSRWSGSTVNGDIASAIPEGASEAEAVLQRKSSNEESQISPPRTPSKLEELPQAILNSLTPSNIRNTTSNLIREWEKSLTPSPRSSTYGADLQDFNTSTQ
ncbi:hypothetical protein F5B22DRAFT_343520 [Xylaria bambusicola]|uniref:uncharacterized protein n=1 Tax=Xylaria bambusicola TaxID=326684 RepID=UPI002008CC1C|nr:uncharacterized protein F5B22DRAFT_343520 [Xylaria bambusicola]KAI0525475.1 hypothetical protein F5B22DRAFT_343520 [Xylaria bambusicola]